VIMDLFVPNIKFYMSQREELNHYYVQDFSSINVNCDYSTLTPSLMIHVGLAYLLVSVLQICTSC